MMYDKERIEVLMHDVRMQLVNVFRWACLGGRVQRSGCHTGLNVLPQLRLEVSRCRWMCRALIVFLLEWLVSPLHMLDCCCVPVHLVLFGSCMYCDAVFALCLFTAPLCSLILFSSVLSVSLM